MPHKAVQWIMVGNKSVLLKENKIGLYDEVLESTNIRCSGNSRCPNVKSMNLNLVYIRYLGARPMITFVKWAKFMSYGHSLLGLL